jgi:ParB-like chromosome segregation protein Spo0J
MPQLKPTHHEPLQVVPSGHLRRLSPDEIKPSTNNPRVLFDKPQLAELKKNIGQHGVLVPLTVFQPKGQTKFSILDGERRYRCVVELNDEGHLGPDGKPLKLPANIVEPPDMIAGLLYMFSIHNYREGWELMPTAKSLETVMDALGEGDNAALMKLTGLSERQIERCKILLTFPKRFQDLSLDPDPKTRIPSNFWIEAYPVLKLALERIPSLKKLGRDNATDKLVEKYKSKKIKSVIHFRKILEAYSATEDDKVANANVVRTIEQFFFNPKTETRELFDTFIVDKKRIETALSACENFIGELQKFKLRYTSEDADRNNLREALSQVRAYCESLEESLRGSDDPTVIDS